MSSDRVTLRLPDELRAWVASMVEHGGYEHASEYVRDLIRQDRRRRLREAIDTKLTTALDSGPASEMTEEDWASIRRRRAAISLQRDDKQPG